MPLSFRIYDFLEIDTHIVISRKVFEVSNLNSSHTSFKIKYIFVRLLTQSLFTGKSVRALNIAHLSLSRYWLHMTCWIFQPLPQLSLSSILNSLFDAAVCSYFKSIPILQLPGKGDWGALILNFTATNFAPMISLSIPNLLKFETQNQSCLKKNHKHLASTGGSPIKKYGKFGPLRGYCGSWVR